MNQNRRLIHQQRFGLARQAAPRKELARRGDANPKGKSPAASKAKSGEGPAATSDPEAEEKKKGVLRRLFGIFGTGKKEKPKPQPTAGEGKAP